MTKTFGIIEETFEGLVKSMNNFDEKNQVFATQVFDRGSYWCALLYYAPKPFIPQTKSNTVDSSNSEEARRMLKPNSEADKTGDSKSNDARKFLEPINDNTPATANQMYWLKKKLIEFTIPITKHEAWTLLQGNKK